MGDIARRTINAHPGYVAGRWYFMNSGLISNGTAPNINSIRLLPFMLLAPITASDLGVVVSVADAAGSVQAAIYNSDPTAKLPTTVAASTGSMSTASTTEVSADITGANVLLAPGLYWQAINTNSATAAFFSIHLSSSIPDYLIGTATLANLTASTSTTCLVRTFAQTFGTWPDLTGQTIAESLGSAAAAVALKAA